MVMMGNGRVEATTLGVGRAAFCVAAVDELGHEGDEGAELD